MIAIAKPAEFERADDLQKYFQALREYNVALGAYDMSPEQIRDARRREALSYAKVRKLKDELIARGIPV